MMEGLTFTVIAIEQQDGDFAILLVQVSSQLQNVTTFGESFSLVVSSQIAERNEVGQPLKL